MAANQEDVCKQCRKSLTRASSITQWIRLGDHCKCGETGSVAGTNVRSGFNSFVELPRKCRQCGGYLTVHAASLTQWVFQSYLCSCQSEEVSGPPRLDPGSDSQLQVCLLVEPDSFPLDRYDPIKELGSGGAGVVYLCSDRVLGKQVAIKTLHKLSHEQLIAFQREARISAQLRHPNILTVLDFGATTSEQPYMVMPFFEDSISADDYLMKFGPMTEAMAVSVFRKLSSALQYAHEQGIYHGDLKPSNLIITGANSVNFDIRIIDFGVANTVQEYQEPTIINGQKVCGTPAYMSPEQVHGQSINSRSEVYSLGCVMFELVVGRAPFAGDSSLEVLRMHLAEPVPTITKEGISSEFEEIVKRCLSKDPDDRFQSMAQLLEALAPVQEEMVLETARVGSVAQRIRNLELLVSRSESKAWAFALIAFFIQMSPAIFYFCAIFVEVPDTSALEKFVSRAVLIPWCVACALLARARRRSFLFGLFGFFELFGFLGLSLFLPTKRNNTGED